MSSQARSRALPGDRSASDRGRPCEHARPPPEPTRARPSERTRHARQPCDPCIRPGRREIRTNPNAPDSPDPTVGVSGRSRYGRVERPPCVCERSAPVHARTNPPHQAALCSAHTNEPDPPRPTRTCEPRATNEPAAPGGLVIRAHERTRPAEPEARRSAADRTVVGRTNPRDWGMLLPPGRVGDGLIAASPLRLDLAPGSRHLQVSPHPAMA